MAEKEKQEVAETSPEQNLAQATVNNALIEALTKQIIGKQEAGLELPPGYNVNNALMGAYMVLKETGLTSKCTAPSIANALMEMATSGLSAQKKQCYFVAFKNSCQLMISYHGKQLIAKRCGMKNVVAEVIYKDDNFKYEIQYGKKIVTKHEQSLENIDPEKIIGAYAVVTMQDGERFTEIMNIDQIKQAWKQGYGYNEKDSGSVHSKFKDQMAKKTVIGRALKSIINTHGDDYMEEIVDREAPTHAEQVEAEHESATEEANSVEFEEEVEAAEAVTVEAEVVTDEEMPDFMQKETM